MVIRCDYLLLILPNDVSLPGSRGQNGAGAGGALNPATTSSVLFVSPGRTDHEGVVGGGYKDAVFLVTSPP